MSITDNVYERLTSYIAGIVADIPVATGGQAVGASVRFIDDLLTHKDSLEGYPLVVFQMGIETPERYDGYAEKIDTGSVPNETRYWLYKRRLPITLSVVAQSQLIMFNIGTYLLRNIYHPINLDPADVNSPIIKFNAPNIDWTQARNMWTDNRRLVEISYDVEFPEYETGAMFTPTGASVTSGVIEFS